MIVPVILESPFAGDPDPECKTCSGTGDVLRRYDGGEPDQCEQCGIGRNVRSARACMRDSLLRDEAPFASHLLYTQPGVLDDGNPDERRRGIAAGLAIGKLCRLTVVYQDLGISRGMHLGIENARECGRLIVFRWLVGEWLR